MSSSPSSSDAQAAQFYSQGCLRRFWFPPVSVLLIGLLLALGLSRIEIGEAAPESRSADFSLSSGGPIASLFTPEVQTWSAEIQAWSEKYQLDPNLVATVMQIESCGYDRAVSPSGAKGLFQVMPYHFQEGENPFEPGINASRGLHYLRQALEAGGNVRLALAGYNGGIQGAQNPQELWPEETSRYVYWGLQIYRDAKSGKEHSPRLEEWLSSGGAYLCQQAVRN